MKTLAAIVSMTALACFCMALVPAPPPYKQPQDNNVREIASVSQVHDGDTITCCIRFVHLGQMKVGAENMRLRLKNVSCLEIGKGTDLDKATAIKEREALAARIFGAKTLSARLYYHQTHDRYEAEIFDEKGSINDLMKTFPQGGR